VKLNLAALKEERKMADVKATTTLIEDAYQKIKQMIFQQKVTPGQRLIYSDLSKMLDMSRTPIINALNRLEQEGFLVSVAFRGFQVRPIDLQEAWDLFGVREALEVYAVEQSIEKSEPRDISALEEKLRTHESYMPGRYDRKKFLLDAEFHLQIASIARNRSLENMLRMNLEHVNLRFRLDNCDTGRMPVAVQEHRGLVKAIKKKDVLKSVEIVKTHVRRGRDTCISCLSAEEDSIHL
jgi:DNA-binding GntR family transcriptional regulator